MKKRMKVLMGQRRMLALATLAVLLLAVIGVIGSGAAFTSQSTNPGNSFTAAGFRIHNQHEGVAVFNVTKMKPGDSSAQTWWVELEAGSADGDVSLTLDNIADVPGPGGGALSALLRVTVVDDTTSTTLVNNAALADTTVAVPGTGGAEWTEGERHDFTVTVTWPDGAPAVDNLRKGSNSTFDITWDATSI